MVIRDNSEKRTFDEKSLYRTYTCKEKDTLSVNDCFFMDMLDITLADKIVY